LETVVSPPLDTSRMQVTQTSNSRAFSYAANHTDNDTQMTRDRTLPCPNLRISRRSACTIQVQQVIVGMPIHQYFQRHVRNTQQCTARLLRTRRERKYSPTHHSTSWRIAGPITAKSMSWLPNMHRHLCDAPIYGWTCICINVLLSSTTISIRAQNPEQN
jgi:hypothetical protein